MKNRTHLKNLGKDIILYGLMEGLARSMSLLLLPIFTRAFSPAEYGIIEIMIIYVNLLSTLASLSLPMSVARHFHAYDDDSEVKEHISTTIVIVSALSVVLMVLGLAFSSPIAGFLLNEPSNGIYVIMCTAAGLFTALASIPLMVLRMQRRIITFNMLSLFYALLYAGLAILFVLVLNKSLIGVFQALVIASAAQFVVSIPFTLDYVRPVFSSFHFKESLSFSLPLLPNGLLRWINQQIDRLMLLAFIGQAAVGVFGAAAKLGVIITFASTAFKKAWNPLALGALKSPSDERTEFYRIALNYFAATFAMLALLMTAISPELLSILTPQAYQYGFVIVPWVMGAGILRDSASITQMGTLLEKRTYTNSIASAIGTLINLVFAFSLIPRFGIFGAAIGSFAAELIFTGLLWKFSAHFSSVKFDKGTILTIFITYVISASLLLSIALYLTNDAISLILRLLIVCLTSILILRHVASRVSIKELLESLKDPREH